MGKHRDKARDRSAARSEGRAHTDNGGVEESVKVAVRVRPFNKREANAKCCVEMNSNQTSLIDPNNPNKEPKRFAFDFSYWSFDGGRERSDGYMEPDPSHPNGKKYCDQQKVFNDLGVGILKNAWEGYNSTLFAYGQTGSGKSYSVVGYAANKGIVPMFCEKLFQEISAKKGGDTQYEVTFSMLEIYNEVVRDLLSGKGNKKRGLKVRETKKKGFWAEGLTVVPVDSYETIKTKMDEGTTNRTIASTNMNATSSRAHTIVSINFIQKCKNAAGDHRLITSFSMVTVIGKNSCHLQVCGELYDTATGELDITSFASFESYLESSNYAHKSACIKHQALSQQLQSYAQLYNKTETEMGAALEQIVECKRELDEAKVVKRHKQEYDQLAHIINTHPDRAHLHADLERARVEIERCESQQKALIEKLEVRKKQFHMLLVSLYELQQLLDDEKEGSGSVSASRETSVERPMSSAAMEVIDEIIETSDGVYETKSKRSRENERPADRKSEDGNPVAMDVNTA